MVIGVLVVVSVPGNAQAPRTLTLKDACAIALKNQPQIGEARYRASAAAQVPVEIRSSYFPTLYGSMTGVGAAADSRVAAGSLNNPIIFNRYADGLTLSQLVTDFGRTARLIESSKFHAQSLSESLHATEAQVLLQVDQAYYSGLQAQALLKVAEQTVSARQLVVDQVTALEASKLKSALDVSFAKVNLSESKLLLAKAQNNVQAAYAQLSAAMGYVNSEVFDLTDEPIPPPPPQDSSPLVSEALKTRPELASLRLEYDSTTKFAVAEKDLWFPTLSGIATGGVIPVHESALHDRYGAVGLNVNFPIFNGHLFSARRAEANLRAQAAAESLRDMEDKIARDVRLTWLNANTAYQRLELTAQLLDQANQALDLAQARYTLGLGSIVELSQAQLNSTAAEIEQKSAKYDYLIQYSDLQYEVGSIH